jgi:Heliorhodopsin
VSLGVVSVMQDDQMNANSPDRTKRLRNFNLGAGALHLVQAIVVLVLTNERSLPVTGAFGNGPPGQPSGPLVLETLFSYRIGLAVFTFLALSAFFHFLVASPWGFPKYQNELANTRNRFRWIEYSISSTVMVILIAGIVGITDVAALLGIAGVNASMIFFGWLMETTNKPGPSANWAPFRFGSFAGIIPWIAIVVYVVGASQSDSGDGSGVPGFVYGIFASLFLFFNSFAITQMLQYRGTGKWADYLHGERAYIILSLTAKSALAWQIFSNVLIPTV